MTTGTIERILRKDKFVVSSAVSVIVLLTGVYTVMGVGMDMSALEMTRIAGNNGMRLGMDTPVVWAPGYMALLFVMWLFMMIAMMTPSAAPTLLLFTALKRHGTDRMRAPLYCAVFLAGYILIWALFSMIASSLQWLLGATDLLSESSMTVTSGAFAGLVLLCAGLYQFSNLKNACLEHCRSPYEFLIQHNQSGLTGALRMGVHHGTYCLGCCWALMALLFVGGIMNLYWIAGLAIYVVLEKNFAKGGALTKVTGAALVVVGAIVLFLAGISLF